MCFDITKWFLIFQIVLIQLVKCLVGAAISTCSSAPIGHRQGPGGLLLAARRLLRTSGGQTCHIGGQGRCRGCRGCRGPAEVGCHLGSAAGAGFQGGRHAVGGLHLRQGHEGMEEEKGVDEEEGEEEVKQL